MAPRGRPPKKIHEWPFAPPPLGRPGTALQRTSELVDVFAKVGGGRPAQALARGKWPCLWDGSSERWTQDQLEAREAVELWVRTHARDLDWKLDILGSRSDNSRDEMRATATAYKNAARHLRCWATDPKDGDKTDRAVAAVGVLPGYRNVEGVTPLNTDHEEDIREIIRETRDLACKKTVTAANTAKLTALMKWITSHADECDRVEKDIETWLKDNFAKGGTDLAAREIAKLVAQFIDDARDAAERIGFSSEELPRVAFADSEDHKPKNPYCVTVKSVLEVLGQPPDRWRYAAAAICEKRKSES